MAAKKRTPGAKVRSAKPDRIKRMNNSLDDSNEPTYTCKRTRMNLNATKSHTGQYTTRFIIVGNESRFNHAIISALFSPEPGNQGNKYFTIKFLN